MSNPLVIAIDHGNKNIKTPNNCFVSGYKESLTKNTMGADYVFYEGKYYSLTPTPFAYEQDKSVNEHAFILSLFAIAKELIYLGKASEFNTIKLAVGLPPLHISLQDKWKEYFLKHFKGGVQFVYNDRTFYVIVDSVNVYPQAFSALTIEDSKHYLEDYNKIYVIDIGGWTVDFLQIINDVPDTTTCASLDAGTVTMSKDIAENLMLNKNFKTDQVTIEAVLQGKKTALDKDIVDYINDQAKIWTDEKIINSIMERAVNLKDSPIIFIGGGSLLLRKHLEESDKICSEHIFSDSINANARGYLEFENC